MNSVAAFVSTAGIAAGAAIGRSTWREARKA
jgi:hypothetical protein